MVVTFGTQPVGCYTEVACLYMEPVYGGHLKDTTNNGHISLE